jgi:flavodoxin
MNFLKYLTGGRQTVMKEKPSLQPFDKDPMDYDLIFIGTPVWAWNFTPAVRTFISKSDLKGKKTAVFCCHNGSAGKTLDNMKAALTGSIAAGEMEFFEPLGDKSGESRRKAEEWADMILGL